MRGQNPVCDVLDTLRYKIGKYLLEHEIGVTRPGLNLSKHDDSAELMLGTWE